MCEILHGISIFVLLNQFFNLVSTEDKKIKTNNPNGLF